MLGQEKAAVMDETESRLRAEIEELKRRLAERETHKQSAGRPKRTTLWLLALLAVVCVTGAFFAGYLPRAQRQLALAAEADQAEKTLPIVNVVTVTRSAGKDELILPGTIQPLTEAPILARSNGYVKRRTADIGDHVKAGQILAELEAPELIQMLKQAQASLAQASSAVEQSQANLHQSRTNEKLAQVTAGRWANLFKRGVVSRQENDTYQAQYEAAVANTQALEKGVAAARNNVSAAEANVERLSELQGFSKVRAPFDGVITVRNVDTGALVSEGTTLLFRIAQMDRVRTYVNAPQSDSESIHAGQTAGLTIPDLQGRTFTGVVTRTANALDPSTRTLLVEVQFPNPSGLLMPGMYAQVNLTTPRQDPPLKIPGDTLVVRSDGPQVAVVGPDHVVRYQRIRLGRDFGDHLEVLAGLQAGQQIAVNPGDTAREGSKVNPVLLRKQ